MHTNLSPDDRSFLESLGKFPLSGSLYAYAGRDAEADRLYTCCRRLERLGYLTCRQTATDQFLFTMNDSRRLVSTVANTKRAAWRLRGGPCRFVGFRIVGEGVAASPMPALYPRLRAALDSLPAGSVLDIQVDTPGGVL